MSMVVILQWRPVLPLCIRMGGGSRRSKIMEIWARYPRYRRIGAAPAPSRWKARRAIIVGAVRGIMADDARTMSWTVLRGLSHCGGATLRLVALLGFALTLGACTKCDVPAWQHSSTGDASVACHDSPAPQ